MSPSRENVPNLITRLVDDVILVVHSSRDPTDQEWADYLRVIRETATPQDRVPLMRVLVVTAGGAPTRKQRRMHQSTCRDLDTTRTPLAVVTSSLHVKSVVTGFGLFGLNTRAFDPEDAASGLRWLALDAPRCRQLAAALEATVEIVDGGPEARRLVEALHGLAREAAPEARLRAERQRIARDLHDGLGSALAGLQWRMRVVAADDRGRSADVGAELEALGARLEGVLDELRGVVWTMSAAEWEWSSVASYTISRVQQLDARGALRRYHTEGDPRQRLPRAVVLRLIRETLAEVRVALDDASESRLAFELKATRRELEATVSVHRDAGASPRSGPAPRVVRIPLDGPCGAARRCR